jgi:hypothetical protein
VNRSRPNQASGQQEHSPAGSRPTHKAKHNLTKRHASIQSEKLHLFKCPRDSEKSYRPQRSWRFPEVHCLHQIPASPAAAARPAAQTPQKQLTKRVQSQNTHTQKKKNQGKRAKSALRHQREQRHPSEPKDPNQPLPKAKQRTGKVASKARFTKCIYRALPGHCRSLVEIPSTSTKPLVALHVQARACRFVQGNPQSSLRLGGDLIAPSTRS